MGRRLVRSVNPAPRSSTDVGFPQIVRVRQKFERPQVADVASAVKAAIGGVEQVIRSGDRIALGVGSRYITNLGAVVRTTIDHLKRLGAQPFIVPAMGSHGGATADGQRAVLASYGITEESMGCEVRATMEVVQVGETLGMPVWLDRFAAEADWIAVANRVKPHTGFKGQIESGMLKMLGFGLGKHEGVKQYHRANLRHGYEKVVMSVGREVLTRKKVAFGLAIVENGYDETARIEAFAPGQLEAGEKTLLAEAKRLMARLPFREIDVLVVEQMGKDCSGSGMDTNVIGRVTDPFERFDSALKVTRVVVLDLTEKSHGNAIGMGNADFTTQRLFQKVDMRATMVNALAAAYPTDARVPVVLPTDEQAIAAALDCVGALRPEDARLVRVRNTLHIDELEVSESLLAELRSRPEVEVISSPQTMRFDAEGKLLPFEG